jgi:hypothetical protein
MFIFCGNAYARKGSFCGDFKKKSCLSTPPTNDTRAALAAYQFMVKTFFSTGLLFVRRGGASFAQGLHGFFIMMLHHKSEREVSINERT